MANPSAQEIRQLARYQVRPVYRCCLKPVQFIDYALVASKKDVLS